MKSEIIAELRSRIGAEHVLDSLPERIAYSYDATWGEQLPDVVVLAESVQHVSDTLIIANRERLPVVARGAGSGLSGGSLPVPGGICLCLTRMNKIVDILPGELVAIVQPGVVNLDLQHSAEKLGLFFPPDPASWYMATLGGNAAENAGGPRCLKYGVTKDYVLGLQVVLADGSVTRTGGRTIKNVAGYDLTSLFVGSEGTLGVITELTLKLLPKPPARKTVMAAFESIKQACDAVDRTLTSGILPLTTEIMDGDCIAAVQNHRDFGLPSDVDAILIIDVEGWPDAIEQESQIVANACQAAGARSVRRAADEVEADQLWAGRREAAAAMSSLGDKLGEDIAVPRNRIPDMIQAVRAIGKKHGLRVPIFGHIGDGNLHPYIICDRSDPAMMDRVRLAAAEIAAAAVELEGTLSGEHGIGLAKREILQRSTDPIAWQKMREIKRLFDPNNILNPGKIFADGD